MWSNSGVKLGKKDILDIQERSSERSKNTSFEGPVLYIQRIRIRKLEVDKSHKKI